MESIGDTSRPRVFCLKCETVIYCDDIWTDFPPRTAERRLKRIHERTGCDGEIEYMAGVRLRRTPRGAQL